ncbi:MAG: ParA family protein [Syntrophus sp. (in: bacteria)]
MIIIVINNKGGVGKTTITTNIAHGLANRGKKILVIDQDPQANTTSILSPPVGANTLYSFYSENSPVSNFIYPTPYENLDIIPNENATATLELELYSDIKTSYHLLRDKIREYAVSNYDHTLIDSPPNLGIFVMMGLICADSAIIPIEAGSRYSIDGFVAAYEAIQAASKKINHDLKFLRAAVNKVDMRTSVSKTSVEYLRRQFGDKLFNTTIPLNTEIQKAEMDRQTVIRHSPHSTGAKKFRLLTDELLELIDS